MTADKAVLDASVFVRAAVERSTHARAWLDATAAEQVEAHVPELVYAEIASSLLKYVRAGTVSASDAGAALQSVVRFPVHVHRLRGLAPTAFALAVETGLSAYDCCYASLAAAIGAPLVTADRRLAQAVPSAELLA